MIVHLLPISMEAINGCPLLSGLRNLKVLVGIST